MAVKKYKANTAGRRGMTSQDFSMVTTRKPKKSLVKGKRTTSGRDSQGHVSVRHRGGGVKKLYRQIPFKRDQAEATVVSIEYDPNRSARIALIKDLNNKQQYIIAPHNLKVGQKVFQSDQVAIEPGNRTTLKNIPVGTSVYEIELEPGKGGQIIRSAGSSGHVLAIEGKYAMVKLPSGEIRQFLVNSKATIGQVSNIHHNQVVIGKAGRKRLMGIRPTVRGKAMYPKAHPHGGGEGNTGIGLKAPKTKWGVIALGIKTRKKTLVSNKFIVKGRKKKR